MFRDPMVFTLSPSASTMRSSWPRAARRPRTGQTRALAGKLHDRGDVVGADGGAPHGHSAIDRPKAVAVMTAQLHFHRLLDAGQTSTEQVPPCSAEWPSASSLASPALRRWPMTSSPIESALRLR